MAFLLCFADNQGYVAAIQATNVNDGDSRKKRRKRRIKGKRKKRMRLMCSTLTKDAEPKYFNPVKLLRGRKRVMT